MPETRYVLALDEGSTGVRALVFDRDGRLVSRSYREIGASYPRPGWVEHDAEAIWTRTLEVAREALAQTEASARDVAAIGLTGQRSTAVVWSRTSGRPLHAALSWQDLRTSERCAELAAAGYIAEPLAAATKFEWMLRNVSEVRAAVERGDALLGTVESWLVWKLSGGAMHVTDASFASATCLFDFFEKRWSTGLLGVLGVPETTLPEIRPSSDRYGVTEASVFGASVPIAGLAGDQQAAMFGQLCLEPGATKISYGTSAMADLNAGTSLLFSSNGAFPMVLWKLGEELHYCIEGVAITAGGAIQWLRDGLGLLGSVAESGELAQGVADTAGVWAVPAFQGLGTPHLDRAARAMIGGLSRGSTRAHVVRAVLEGVALRSAEVFDALAADSPSGRPAILRADGGAAQNDFLMQFQSDVLGIPVERPEVLESAATGAAYLAGLAVGFWPNLDGLGRIRRLGGRFEPRMSADERGERRERFRKHIAAAREVGS